MAEKISGTSAKGVRKRQLSVQEIREALAELDQARVEMDADLALVERRAFTSSLPKAIRVAMCSGRQASAKHLAFSACCNDLRFGVPAGIVAGWN